jgi:hypothetical protein
MNDFTVHPWRFACSVRKVFGMYQVPSWEPLTKDIEAASGTGSTGIQKLTFCRPSTL